MAILVEHTRAPIVCEVISTVNRLDNSHCNVGKRNEVAHVQYAANLRQCPTDPLSIAHKMLCAFLLEELLIMESALNFFLSIWSQLRSDCTEVFKWLKDPTQTVS